MQYAFPLLPDPTFFRFVHQAPVIRLKNLMVREVATDRKAIFLVSTSLQGPEMYEIVCESPSEKKRYVSNRGNSKGF